METIWAAILINFILTNTKIKMNYFYQILLKIKDYFLLRLARNERLANNKNLMVFNKNNNKKIKI